MKLFCLFLCSLTIFVPSILLYGQNRGVRYFELVNIENQNNNIGIALYPDGFLDYRKRHELIDVYQRGCYLETDSSIEMYPFVPSDSLNILNVSQVGITVSGKVEIFFVDIFNQPISLLVSGNGIDWNDTVQAITIPMSAHQLFIKSFDFEYDYLKHEYLRTQPYRWEASRMISLDEYSGKKIRVVIAEDLYWMKYSERRWWNMFDVQIILKKNHSGRYSSSDNNYLMRKISEREFNKKF